MHLLEGRTEVLRSAVPTHSAVRIGLQLGGGQLLTEWVRPRAPDMVPLQGPVWEAPVEDVAQVQRDLQDWIKHQLDGHEAFVGALSGAMDAQDFVDTMWQSWLGLARVELTRRYGSSFRQAASPHAFTEFDPLQRACKG